jgi:kumamolisin
MAKRPLKGSERAALPDARAIGPADQHERLEVTVILRSQASTMLEEHVSRLERGDRSAGALSRDAFASAHGASAADRAAVKAFAHSHGLSVVQEHAARRTIILAGTVAQFNQAFGVELKRYDYPGGSYRGREGAIQIPEELGDIIEAVLGLDNRPQARAHFRIRTPQRRSDSGPRGRTSSSARASAAAVSYKPTQLASLYEFPQGTASGQCVAIVELGGGFRPQDLATYFAKLGVAAPAVTAVSVDHGANQPTGNPDGPDGEVMLDIEVIGAVAADVSIAVYFAPNTDAGFLNAVTTAIHDTVRKPSVISISWGGPESSWTAQAMKAMDQAFQAAAALGVTVCVASGDGGSSDGVSGAAAHVDFPASSPFALSCGGTSLRATGKQITSETVWNDQSAGGGAGGGGVSAFFPVPSWQQGLAATASAGTRAPLSGRGVPDVAGDADPQTGYDVRIDGADTVIGGTSAVAPLWAGLIALANAANGRAAGYLNAMLYTNPAALRDIVQGNNGAYGASVGWDACTGLGCPIGQRVAAVVGQKEL